MQIKQDLDVEINDLVGEPVSEKEAPFSLVRAFYNRTYRSLDRIDQEWYDGSYHRRNRSWEICYTWAIILNCILNARSAHVEATGHSIAVKEWMRLLSADIKNQFAFR